MRYIVLFFVLSVSLLVGCNDDSEGSVKAEDVQSVEEELSALKADVFDLEEEKSSLENDIESKEDELSDLKEETEELVALKEDREELENASNELEDVQKELESLKKEVVEREGEPIKISAGHYWFGEDIDPNKYEIQIQEGHSGNVKIFNSDGENEIREVMSSDNDGFIDSYVITVLHGYKIETAAPLELHPLKIEND